MEPCYNHFVLTDCRNYYDGCVAARVPLQHNFVRDSGERIVRATRKLPGVPT